MRKTSAFNIWVWAASAWLIFFSVLFCLPGSALPSSGWMNAIQFDKWVHIGIFFGLIVLWSRALSLSNKSSLLLLALVAIAYGFGVEVVQDRLIVNRSFDMYDLAADAIGVVWGFAALRYTKK